jgi:uncharacterized protein YebE (UPF0316 family)
VDPLDLHPALVCLLIFLARIADVSLGTLRTLLVFRGERALASLLGFVEVLVWLLAAAQVLRNLDAWYLAVSYAAGFAAGNAVGMWLEGRLAMGTLLVRAISADPAVNLARTLREREHDVVHLNGHGRSGQPVEVLLVTERRRQVPALLRLIREVDPEAVCTTNDVREHPVVAASRRGPHGFNWRRFHVRK